MAAKTQYKDALIKVADFTMAREAEMKYLMQTIRTRNGTRRTFQTLPRHLRRRTMSHNIYRIPRRLRDSAKREMEGVEGPKKLTKRFRKHKRRPTFILQDYIRRQKSFKWIETHIWHAKRMKMTSLWGFKIALHLRDKGSKMMYKQGGNQCIVHDLSYFECFQLSGTQESIVSFFSTLKDPSISNISNGLYLSGRREGQMFLYENSTFPFGAVAPVSFLWNSSNSCKSNESRRLHIWIHPSFHSQVVKTLQSRKESFGSKIDIQELGDQLLRFRIMGPRSHSVLSQVLKFNESVVNSKVEEKRKLWNNLLHLRSTASISGGAVIGLDVADPRLSFPPKHWKKVKEEEFSSRSPSVGNCLLWPTSASQSDIWDSQLRQNVERKIEQKKRGEKKEEKKENVGEIPIVLIQQTSQLSRGFGSGWDLILPKGWGMPFWMSFIYAGARACALLDVQTIDFEQGKLSTTVDYPDTLSGRTEEVREKKEKEERYAKIPPAKRVNYKKMGVKNPFGPDWEGLFGGNENMQIDSTKLNFFVARKLSDARSSQSNSLVRVSLRSMMKGRIHKNAEIFLPTSSDLEQWKKDPNTPFINHQTKLFGKKQVPQSRKAIGYITSGGYSFVRGRGFGIGYCLTSQIIPLLERQLKKNQIFEDIVLVRNADSPLYRPALITFQFDSKS
eukprot:TRINITY_DN6012_c0_g1_i1.p1 TRINITY_DN6012_c0_g1~~TRINITY_DN6012_c0_g1_i1.p1  ORF type:complete len:672 (+),score=252.23 TRINITY_DN6012_c0_g1_i1:25-2040(+)